MVPGQLKTSQVHDGWRTETAAINQHRKFVSRGMLTRALKLAEVQLSKSLGINDYSGWKKKKNQEKKKGGKKVKIMGIKLEYQYIRQDNNMQWPLN